MGFLHRIGRKDLAIEVFGVVFAVLLALWVDEWREDSRLAEAAAELRERVVGEVRANLVEIVDATKKSADLRKHNDAIVKQKGWEDDKEAASRLRWSFIAADLKSSSWQIALLDAAATVMDVDFLSDASNIYRHQHMYDSYVNSLVEALDDDVLLIERDVRSAHTMHATRVMLLDNFSRQLKADYEAFLQKHGAKDAANEGAR